MNIQKRMSAVKGIFMLIAIALVSVMASCDSDKSDDTKPPIKKPIAELLVSGLWKTSKIVFPPNKEVPSSNFDLFTIQDLTFNKNGTITEPSEHNVTWAVTGDVLTVTFVGNERDSFNAKVTSVDEKTLVIVVNKTFRYESVDYATRTQTFVH